MKQFVLALLIVTIHVTATSQILYVDKNATGANDGSSWANAFTTLTAAVAEANANATIQEIRIGINGVYTGNEYFIRRSYDISGSWNTSTNTQAGSPLATTTLDGELAHRIMTIDAGVTISLSGICFLKGGNIGVNGGAIVTKGNVKINNCYFRENLISASGNYNIETSGNGGAIANEGILVIKNSQFVDNSTTYSGGAILNRKELTVTDCLFERNVAGNRGGAIANNFYGGTIQLSKCRFKENSLVRQAGTSFIWDGSGGALSLEGAGANILNCIFDKNKAHGGGAIWSIRWMVLRNCTFFANEVYNTNIHGNGGAIYAFAGWGIGIQNCAFWDNITPVASDKSLYIYGGKASVANCIFPAGTTGPASGTDLRDNLNDNPLFTDAANGDFHLQPTSPAINKGDNAVMQASDLPGDHYGELRISPCTIDIGAAEYQLVNANGLKPDNNGILYVDKASTYNTFGDKGSDWSKALPSLNDALLYANTCGSVREIHVAKGTYQEDPLITERGYILLGSYDPATNNRDWKNHPTIIDLKISNNIGRLLLTTPTIDTRLITVDGFVFRNASKTALVNSTELLVTNCAFYNNQSVFAGGAVSNTQTIRLLNCVFNANSSNISGGALHNKGTCALVNTTMHNHTAASQTGKAIYNESGSMKIHNSIISGPTTGNQILNGGTLELNRNIINGVAGNTPGYVNDAYTDKANQVPWYTDDVNGNLTLRSGSPAINKGSNTLYQAAIGNTSGTQNSFDMAYKTRIYDDVIDLGAFERQMKQQTISVTDITATYGDAPLMPATINSGLPVSYSSANSQIAEIFTDTDNKKKVRIRNKGTAAISASQVGNAVYDPAEPVYFTVTVNPKPVTVTAEAKSKVYGDADPALTFTVAPALVAGDVFTGNPGRDAGEGAGNYAIQQNDLAAGDNYVVSYTGADLIINKKAIAITAESKNKNYGESDPAFTYTFSPALAFSDAFSGALSRQGGENVGSYAIQNGLTLSNNYTLSYTGANLVIDPKAITVTAADKSKTYGAPDPALTYSIVPSLVGNDVLAGNIDRATGEDVGTYAITQGNLSNSNYSIGFVPALLTIGKASQQITWNQLLTSACDGTSLITLTGISSSGLPLVYQSANTAIATVTNNQLAILQPGLTTITASQPGNNNYLPAANVPANLSSRLPAALLVKHWNDVLLFDNSSKAFNGWQWYKNGSPVNGATGQYYYESGNLTGEYYALVKTTGGEILTTCPITVTPGATQAPMTVFPNPVGPGQQVTVKVNYTSVQLQGATIIITNNTGTVVGTQQNLSPQTSFSMPLIQGLYVVRLKLTNGITHAVNVLVTP